MVPCTGWSGTLARKWKILLFFAQKDWKNADIWTRTNGHQRLRKMYQIQISCCYCPKSADQYFQVQSQKNFRNPFTIPFHFDRETHVIMKWRLIYRAVLLAHIHTAYFCDLKATSGAQKWPKNGPKRLGHKRCTLYKSQ